MAPIVYLEIGAFMKARRPASATIRARTSAAHKCVPTSTAVIVPASRRLLVFVIVISRDGRSFAEEVEVEDRVPARPVQLAYIQ